MTYTAIEFETDGPIATITMDRPEKRNALNHALLDDLLTALNEVADDDAIKVAILRANGPTFSAGYDIDGSPYINPPDGGTEWNIVSGHKHQRIMRGIYEAIWDNPKVIIAQIHGHAIAGGMYISMLCDLVVASDDAKIGEPYMRMGGASSIPFWSYLVGPRRANDMLFTGRVLSGKEAEEWGLVTRSVPRLGAGRHRPPDGGQRRRSPARQSLDQEGDVAYPGQHARLGRPVPLHDQPQLLAQDGSAAARQSRRDARIHGSAQGPASARRVHRLLEFRIAHEVRRLLVGVARPTKRRLAAQRPDELQRHRQTLLAPAVGQGQRRGRGFMSQGAVYCSRDH